MSEPEATSAQPSGQPEPRLAALDRILARHQGRWSAPYTPAQLEAFARAELGANDGALIIDAGCGTGRSSARIADLHPGARVLGLDRSAKRLVKAEADSRVQLLRANLEPFFAQLAERGGHVDKTYLLFPNPYPKPGQLSRRLYARPGFAQLLAASEHVELRTNWSVYAQEFAHAAAQLSEAKVVVETYACTDPLSEFEAKYARSEHTLWRVRVG